MNPDLQTRRDFLFNASSVATSVAIAAPFIGASKLSGAEVNSDTLKVGLVGCGGRGTGAAQQALSADKNVVLTAIADAFPEKIDKTLATLKADADVGSKVKVDEAHRFVGFDAYQKLIDSGVDVVLLCSPPGFRPAHLEAAVKAGKHVFCEKPMAVDAPGVRSIIASVAEAKQKKLTLVAGYCWRYNLGERAGFQQLHDGKIGDIRAYYGTYNTSFLWSIPRKPEQSDMEWQLRNWLYFTWLSGDHLVEQAIHNVDKLNWAFKNVPPLQCMAHGGRQVRTDPAFGHIYDHFSIVYDYPDEVKGFLFARQQDNCANDNSDTIWGAKGTLRIPGFKGGPFIVGENAWRFRGERPNMYQIEHNELFASIRNGKPMNDGDWMAVSTMMGIMGRMAAYTGKVITWDQAMNSQEKLGPEKISWDVSIPVPPVAMPGKTRFV